MKNSLQTLLFALVTLGLAACGEAPKGEEVEAGEKVEKSTEASAEGGMSYTVDTDASKVNWVGSELVGGKHTGYINLESGMLTVKDGNITGGTFTLDMTSITDTDLSPDDGKAKLEKHLKSDDFFSVEAHPTSTFEIVEVKPAEDNPNATHQITGNLTMKDITKSVTIPAKINMGENKLMASTPQFTIDRKEWDVMFRASTMDVAKDKIINDRIGLTIELQAAPAAAADPAEETSGEMES